MYRNAKNSCGNGLYQPLFSQQASPVSTVHAKRRYRGLGCWVTPVERMEVCCQMPQFPARLLDFLKGDPRSCSWRCWCLSDSSTLPASSWLSSSYLTGKERVKGSSVSSVASIRLFGDGRM